MEPLSDDSVAQQLDDLPLWSHDGATIQRTFDRGDFKGSVAFVNAIMPIAERINHHPDVAIAWNEVTLTLSTHSAGGLTAADFELARLVDALA